MKSTVKIKRISSRDVQTKYGTKRNLSLLVTTSKGQEIWVSGFMTDENKKWKEGDSVELDVEKSGKYWNFKNPPKESVDSNLSGALEAIREELQAIRRLLEVGVPPSGNESNNPPPHDDSDFHESEEDLPF